MSASTTVRILRASALAIAAVAAINASAAVTSSKVKPGDKYFVQGNEECVVFVRRRVPSLPHGLYTLADKKKIINSSTPKKGRAAIIDLGKSGHIALVTDVDDSGSSRSITIIEHNVPIGTSTPQYRKVTCGKKLSDCEKELKILGYFKP